VQGQAKYQKFLKREAENQQGEDLLVGRSVRRRAMQ